MGFRVIVGVAVAVLLLCGVSLAAPAARGVDGEMHGAGSDAAGLNEQLRVGAAELAAVPAESRVLFAKVLGQLDGMRGELEAVRADKARSDERIARLEEESKDCEEQEEQEEQEEMEEMEEMEAEKTENRNSYYINSTARHRKQVGVPACGPASWAARTAAVMDACCPAAPGGHRRAQDTTCPLPDTCPSVACAGAFVAYYDDCALELQGHAAELPLPQFAGFYASCQELASGAGQMLQPVAVQMFRVMVNTDGAAQAASMFPGSGGSAGAGGNLDPTHPTLQTWTTCLATIVALHHDHNVRPTSMVVHLHCVRW
jgi:hypothetical protein